MYRYIHIQYTYIQICKYMHAYVYVYIYVYIHTYIHTYILLSLSLSFSSCSYVFVLSQLETCTYANALLHQVACEGSEVLGAVRMVNKSNLWGYGVRLNMEFLLALGNDKILLHQLLSRWKFAAACCCRRHSGESGLHVRQSALYTLRIVCSKTRRLRHGSSSRSTLPRSRGEVALCRNSLGAAPARWGAAPHLRGHGPPRPCASG